MKIFHGLGRKVALPILLLSTVCWVIYMVTFSWLAENQNTDFDSELRSGFRVGDNRGNQRWFCYWAFVTIGPVFYALAFIHLATGQWYIGIFAHFFTGFFIAAGGGVLFSSGELVNRFNQMGGNELGIAGEDKRFIRAEFVGALLTVILVVVYMMIWPFFTDVNKHLKGKSSLFHSQNEIPPSVVVKSSSRDNSHGKSIILHSHS